MLGSIKNKITTPELLEERASGAGNDKDELNLIFWREKWQSEFMQEESRLMAQYPGVYGNTHQFFDMTPKEIHEQWMKKVKFAYDNLDRSRFFGKITNTKQTWAFYHFG